MNTLVRLSIAGMVVGMLAVTGCIESTTVVRVNKDGTGELFVREFMSTEITTMMEGMGEMVEGMAESMNETMEAENDQAFEKAGLSGMTLDMAKAKTVQFGEGVTLQSVREATNTQGWKGYQARYTFNDVTTLNLSGTPSEGGEQNSGELMYRFEMTPGDTATLRIVSSKPDSAQAESQAQDMADSMPPMEGFEDFDFGDTVQEEAVSGNDMDDLGGAMMGGMMGSMFKGMRMSVYVQVNGDVVETDAKHRSEKRDNIFTLMDMNMDAIMKNPEAMKLMMNNDQDGLDKLSEMGVEGLVMEEPGRTITIQFN
jgi:hypothetical protein